MSNETHPITGQQHLEWFSQELYSHLLDRACEQLPANLAYQALEYVGHKAPTFSVATEAEFREQCERTLARIVAYIRLAENPRPLAAAIWKILRNSYHYDREWTRELRLHCDYNPNDKDQPILWDTVLVAQNSTVQELLADAFVAILEKLPSYDPKRASFTTWAVRITQGIAMNHRAKRIRRGQREEFPASGDKLSVFERMSERGLA